MADTVSYARATPDVAQPWAEAGLTHDEYAYVRARLGRRPTACELAVVARLWSHGPVAGRVGQVGLDDGRTVLLGIAAPREPADPDPAAAAASGLGGLVREVVALGAHPVAVVDAVGSAPPADDGPAAALAGTVAGFGALAHRLGVPVVGGQTTFDAGEGVPRVATLCAAVLPDPAADGAAPEPRAGDRLLVLGLDATGAGPQSMLVDACREARTRSLATAARSIGLGGLLGAAAGLTGPGLGVRIDLAAVAPDDTLHADETALLEEAPGGFLLAVRPDDVDGLRELADAWGVPATQVGEVLDGGDVVCERGPDRLVELDARLLTEAPARARAAARPGGIEERDADRAEHLPRAASDAELAAQVLALAGSPALCDRSPVTDRFDRYAGGDTVAGPPEDAGVVRAEGRGLALAVDANPRHERLNPYLAAQLALSEAYRNVAVTGARPRAAAVSHTGLRDDPAVGWHLAEAALGLDDATATLGLPVVATDTAPPVAGKGRPPSTVVGVLGVLDDLATRTRTGFAWEGDAILLLGATREDLSGSAWADVVHGHLGGLPPLPDLPAERALADVLVSASRRELLSSAHDLSEGGLAQALVESCLRDGLGASLTLPDGDPTVALFAESPARALVSLSGRHHPDLLALCAEHGVPATRLGEVVDTGLLEVVGRFSVSLDDLRARRESPLRDALATVGAR